MRRLLLRAEPPPPPPPGRPGRSRSLDDERLGGFHGGRPAAVLSLNEAVLIQKPRRVVVHLARVMRHVEHELVPRVRAEHKLWVSSRWPPSPSPENAPGLSSARILCEKVRSVAFGNAHCSGEGGRAGPRVCAR